MLLMFMHMCRYWSVDGTACVQCYYSAAIQQTSQPRDWHLNYGMERRQLHRRAADRTTAQSVRPTWHIGTAWSDTGSSHSTGSAVQIT